MGNTKLSTIIKGIMTPKNLKQFLRRQHRRTWKLLCTMYVHIHLQRFIFLRSDTLKSEVGETLLKCTVTIKDILSRDKDKGMVVKVMCEFIPREIHQIHTGSWSVVN